MNDLDKSKEELIKELKKLQQKYDSLKEILKEDSSERLSAEQAGKQVEQALKESSEKFDGLFNKMSVGIVFCKAIYDKNGNMSDCIYEDMNRVYEEFTALKKETAIGEKVSEMLPGTEPEWFKTFGEVVKKRNPITFEMYHKQSKKYYSVVAYNSKKDEFSAIFEDITERKQAEQEIEESKEKYRGLSEAAFECIFLSEKGICIQQNLSAEKKFGYSNEEAIGRKGADWIAPEYREIVMNTILAGYEQPYEALAIKKDGTTFPCMLQGKMMHYKGKAVRVTSLSDITERKHAEEELKESKQKLTDILNNVNDVIWSIAYPGEQVLFVSPSIEKLFEISALDFISDSKLFHKAVYPEDKRIVEKTNKFLPVNGNSKAEYRIVSKSGKIRWIQETNLPVKNEQGKVIRIDGSIKDITEQKEFQNTLEFLVHIAKEFINIPIENLSKEIINALKAIGEYVHADRAYIFDYDFIKNTTSNTFEWCANEIVPEIENLQDVPLDAIPQWVFEHKQGNEMYIANVQELPVGDSLREILEPQFIKSLLTLPMMDKGILIGFVGFDSVRTAHNYSSSERIILTFFIELLVNVKGRLQSLNQLQEAKTAAEDANKAKSEFLANMSHEIRTPMNAILGFSEALYHKLENEQQKNMVKSILNGGNLLMSLLNDILDLSKIEANKIEISTQPVDTINIINEIKLLFFEKSQKKGVALSVEVDDSFPDALMLDEIRIKQIIFNLVGNATKFTHKGYVRIKLYFEHANEKSGTLTIDVADTGIGIAHEQLDLIFHVFRQQSGQSNRKYGGAGLGLAISKRLAEKMGGTIALESEEGKGSVFTLKIPNVEICDAFLVKREKFETLENILFEEAAILIVDDVISNIEMVEILLSDLGLQFITADNGQMALEILKHTTPSLILLDIRMPDLNGYQVAERIKTNPDTKHIPVIALTASVSNNMNDEITKNFDGFLYKPVSKGELQNELMKYLAYSKIEGEKILAQKATALSLNDIPGHVKVNISKIVTILQADFMPKWEEVKDGNVLFEIEDFANDLKQISSKYNFEFLANYSTQLLNDIEMINTEALQMLLADFPDIINKLKNFTN
ncbi:MAG: PAS domain S-box protein [Bacteroidales bacterium]|jgi:PAS domain S-box-containing protein|nr:PAS domain S-box protein [Bacteroidales bacterium]